MLFARQNIPQRWAPELRIQLSSSTWVDTVQSTHLAATNQTVNEAQDRGIAKLAEYLHHVSVARRSFDTLSRPAATPDTPTTPSASDSAAEPVTADLSTSRVVSF